MNEENQNQSPQGQVFQPPQISTSTPTPLVDLNNLKSDRPKNIKKIYGIIIAIFIVILVAVGTVLFLSQNVSKNIDKTTDNSKLTELNQLINSNMGSSESFISKASGPSLVISKAKDNIWVGLPEGSEILSYSSIQNASDQNKSDYDKLRKVLIDFGLVDIETTSSISSKYSSDGITRQYLSSEEIVCNLSNKQERRGLGVDYYLKLHCASDDSFSNVTKELHNYIVAYIEGSLEQDDVLMENLVVNDSPIIGYRNASIGESAMDGSMASRALFYQSKDGVWRYFASSSDLSKIPCNDYDTNDEKNSFVGFYCLEDSSSSSSFVVAPTQVVMSNPEDDSVQGSSEE